MPKSTFFRLAEAKKKSFVQEAYKEFSLHSYDAASITNLVKSLDIAKGSVYQYFEDKEDLYNFLIIDANNQLNTLVDKACKHQGEDFFEWYTKLLMVEVKFMLSFPQFAVLFINLTTAISFSQKQLAEQINQRRQERILKLMPDKLSGSLINDQLLADSPYAIFKILTSSINLQKIISANGMVEVESDKLVSLCSALVDKLKHGL